MTAPLVSICIPTRNRAAALRASLENIRALDYSPIEIIISDNASEDDTEQVCRETAAADPRVQYVRQAVNIGLHGNHNFCLGAGRGEFLCICHDHDVRDTRIVSKYVRFLERHPRVGVVCSDWDLIDDTGARIGVRDHRVNEITPGLEYIGRTLRSGRSSIGIAGAMIRRSALGDIRFVPDAPIGFGDFPIWCQLAEGWDVGHIHERLWSWRQNEVSHSARPIVAIARDYWVNLGSYCDDHVRRWPQHADRVDEWRRSVRRFLFWALSYEVGLHFRKRQSGSTGDTGRTIFEIMDYRLTDEQLQSALEQMKAHRTGWVQYLAYAAVVILVQGGITWPLAWATEHPTSLRALLKLD